MLVVGLIPICAVARQSRPTIKNGCLRVLCRPFCLQPRYYGLPSLLKFDGPTSPGANYEKYDFSENRKVQNPPGWWVFLLTAYKHHKIRYLNVTVTSLLTLNGQSGLDMRCASQTKVYQHQSFFNFTLNHTPIEDTSL